MKSLQVLDRRAGFSFAAIMILFATILPSILPSFASAATVTSRSIGMSSSAAGATNVTYDIKFTPTLTFKGLVIDWCQESPILSTTCTTPGGFSAGTTPAITFISNGPTGSPTTTGSTAGHTIYSASTASASATGVVELTITGVANPSAIGPYYARIYTYAAAPDWTSATATGTVQDSGGIAMDATNPIAISAAVKETMTFCVSASVPSVPTASCTGLYPPALTLGHGTPAALDATATDTGLDYAQISTNASGGANVFMTNSNTSCGGLRRNSAGATLCDIAPQLTSATSLSMQGTATFGMNVGTQTTLSGGAGTIVAQAPYSTANQYGMNWVTGNATGVGSTYGDKIFTTNNAPISNVNIPLTFAASVTNSTPAGIYSANINLVATGTF